MNSTWEYDGVFPNGASNGNNFYGYDGIVAFAGNPYPAVIVDPSEASLHTGEQIEIIAYATNTIEYEWQQSSDNVNWATIAGETEPTLIRSYHHEAGVAGTYYYRVICYGLIGYTISESTRITVDYSPTTVTISSNATSVESPGNIYFIAAAYYADMLQWQHSFDGETWTDIFDETFTNYTAAFTDDDAGEHHYRCVASGLSGTVASTPITITVLIPNA